jgi:molybdopterin molybdotransferase
MLTVSEALEKIITEVSVFSPQEVALKDALGSTLAENVVSDLNNPPFNKALMDGYAIRAEDITEGFARLKVIEEVAAGSVPSRPVQKGEATRIMTGAPLPEGAVLVVPFEESVYEESTGQELTGTVELKASKRTAGSNMMPEATVLKKGDTVLKEGTVLQFQELGALAEIGKSKLKVYPPPEISVLATGDELVEVSVQPIEGQIRNSNETMLVAQIENVGAVANRLGIAKDVQEKIEEKIIQGLKSDILLLSGGVSAGKLDLVPAALKKCGVREVFHKVKLKPGKPIWFGAYQKKNKQEEIKTCYVFGLPGNPVGSMICFELFVKTAIRSLMGITPPVPQIVQAKLENEYSKKGDRELYHPCSLKNESGMNSVSLIRWQGSADLQSTVKANAMAVFPAGDRIYHPGDLVDVLVWHE